MGRMIVTAFLVLFLPACGHTTDFSVPPSARLAMPSDKADMKVPEEADVAALVGQATFDFPDDGDRGPARVSERILDGFQAGPAHLRLDDGSVIHWGFKHEEANLQSIAVHDAQGHLRLLGAVSNLGS